MAREEVWGLVGMERMPLARGVRREFAVGVDGKEGRFSGVQRASKDINLLSSSNAHSCRNCSVINYSSNQRGLIASFA